MVESVQEGRVRKNASVMTRLSRDDCLITLNVMRERRELDGVSFVDCATYLYTFLICLCVCLSNYRSFQKVPSCDLSCDQVS